MISGLLWLRKQKVSITKALCKWTWMYLVGSHIEHSCFLSLMQCSQRASFSLPSHDKTYCMACILGVPKEINSIQGCSHSYYLSRGSSLCGLICVCLSVCLLVGYIIHSRNIMPWLMEQEIRSQTFFLMISQHCEIGHFFFNIFTIFSWTIVLTLKKIWHIYPMIVYHSVYFASDPDAD